MKNGYFSYSIIGMLMVEQLITLNKGVTGFLRFINIRE